MGFHRNLVGVDLHSPSNEKVENNSGSTISKLKAVTFNGLGTAYPQIVLADGVTLNNCRGVVQEDILTGSTGYITLFGLMTEVDTSSFSVNDMLYSDATGNLITTVSGRIVAQVLKVSSTVGMIYVLPPGTSILEDVANHAVNHENGGVDEISVNGLSGVLSDAQEHTIAKDGTSISTYPITNFISGDGTILSVADNTTRTDVTIEVNKVQNIVDVRKNPVGGQFSSIAIALASITDASDTNPYVVVIGPGIYTEPVLNVPDYVSLKGSTIYSTIIEPDAANHHVIVPGLSCELTFLTVQNAGSGYAGIAIVNLGVSGSFVQAHKVSIFDCDTGILLENTSAYGEFWGEYLDINGTYTIGVKIVSSGIYESKANLENTYTFPDDSGTTTSQIKIDGAGSSLTTLACVIEGNGLDNGILITNGAHLSSKAINFVNCATGFYADTNGTSPEIIMESAFFNNCTMNFNIANTTATGEYTGYTEYLKKSINNSNSFFITNKDHRVLTVSKKGGDFYSIAAAADSITDSSTTNRYIIYVGPGIFVEPEINLPPYVQVVGLSMLSTIIEPDDVDHNIFNINIYNEVLFVTVRNAGTGYCGFSCVNSGDFSMVHKVSIFDCDIGIKIDATTADTVFYGEYLDINGTYTNAAKITSSGSYLAKGNFENFYTYPISCSDAQFNMSGTTSELYIIASEILGDSNDTAVYVYNGSFLSINSTFFDNSDIAIHIPNSGSDPTVRISAGITSITKDIFIEHPGTTGSFTGSADILKVFINASASISMSYADHGTVGQAVLQDLYQGSRQDRLINLSKLVRSSSTVGLESGGTITRVSGLEITVAAGNGFLIDPTDLFVKEVSWEEDNIILNANEESYIYVDTNGTLTNNTSFPNLKNVIFLGRAVTQTSVIDYIEKSVININQHGNIVEDFQRDALGPIYVSGSIVSENATAFHLDVTAGNYYYGTKKTVPSGGTNINFNIRYRNGSGGWTDIPLQNVVNHTQYDDNTGTLHSLTSTYYAKHSLYIVGDGTEENYFLVISQAEYSSLSAAQVGNLPTPPPDFVDSVTLIADIIVKEGDANIIQIDDQRPRIGFKASALSAVSNHGDLSGLTSDDHPQYLLVSGTRSMTGNLNMGSQNITSVNLVDGVDVSSHYDRHLPNGSDPLTTAAPGSNLTATTSNGIGSANSLARSDHSHAITTGAVSTQNTDQTNATGTSANIARADHIHNIPTATATGLNADSTNTQGASTSFANASHTHAIASGVVSTQNTDQTNATGTSTNFARADHIHNIPTATPSSIGLSNAQGSATTFAKSDHIHDIINLTNTTRSPRIATTATTLNGTLTLTSVSNTVQFLTGTQTGFSVVLPNATTLTSGHTYEFWNTSSQVIIFKNSSSTILAIVAAGEKIDFILQDNSTSAGIWVSLISSIYGQTVNYGDANGFYLFDEFISADAYSVSEFNQSNYIGSQTVDTIGESGHPGIYRQYISTDNSRASMFLGNIYLDGGRYDFEALIRIDDLATSAQDYEYRIGIMDNQTTSGAPSNGIWFEYNRAVSANWYCKTAKSGTTTSTDSSVAVTQDSWIKLSFNKNGVGSSCVFSINDAVIATNTTNISDLQLVRAPNIKIVKTNGSTQRNFDIDYYMLKCILNATR